MLIGFSGLSVGDVITVPGNEISDVVKRFWNQGLFSDVKIFATKIEDGKIWLQIALNSALKYLKINYHGKKEKLTTGSKIRHCEGNQITPNISDRAIPVIKTWKKKAL